MERIIITLHGKQAEVDKDQVHMLFKKEALNKDIDKQIIDIHDIKMKLVEKKEPKIYTLDEIEVPENIGKKFKVVDGYYIGIQQHCWFDAIVEVKQLHRNVITHRCIKPSPSGYPAIGSYFKPKHNMKFVEATKEDLE